MLRCRKNICVYLPCTSLSKLFLPAVRQCAIQDMH
uniref:T.aestivum DNA sequence of ultraminichromosome (pTA637) n=1 Tax=Triticum aestivum TaxID=4565 RepID=Q41589_WHEAT|nr:unnamed protein product [Triticum aestivum]